MKTVLHLTSSIFADGGQSSRLAEEFVAALRLEHPGAQVIRRDLARDPVPHLDAERFGAFLGITDVEFVYAEGLAIGEAAKQQSLAAARDALRALAQPATLAA